MAVNAIIGSAGKASDRCLIKAFASAQPGGGVLEFFRKFLAASKHGGRVDAEAAESIATHQSEAFLLIVSNAKLALRFIEYAVSLSSETQDGYSIC